MEKFWKICSDIVGKMVGGMERLWFLWTILLTVIALGLFFFLGPDDSLKFLRDTNETLTSMKETPPPSPTQYPLTITAMKLTSTAFEPDGAIPSKYTCDDRNVSPPLQIGEVPPAAKSFALIVDDPDAPAGDWVHWVLWNIDPKTTDIGEGAVPAGAVQGRTDFGDNRWGGPCPPSGVHRYQFKLYALDTVLDLPAATTKKELEKAMNGHTIGKSTLVGTYRRK